jgi:hypothetical protein
MTDPGNDNSWSQDNSSEETTLRDSCSGSQLYNQRTHPGVGDHWPLDSAPEEGVFEDGHSAWQSHNQTALPDVGNSWPLSNTSDGSIDSEIKASIIFFRDSRPYDIPGIENEFPNQKISVKTLLAEDKRINPLMQPCEDNMIRYFHFPANNMIWVEVRVEFLLYLPSC